MSRAERVALITPCGQCVDGIMVDGRCCQCGANNPIYEHLNRERSEGRNPKWWREPVKVADWRNSPWLSFPSST